MSRNNSIRGDTPQTSTTRSQTSENTTKATITEENEENVKDFIADITDIANKRRRDVNGIKQDKSSNNVRPLAFNLNPKTAPTFNAMKPYLSILEDEYSSYNDVSKVCLFLNQFASYGSSSSSSPSMNSKLIEITEDTSNFITMLNKLSSAASHHSDRRCRILTLNSLSLVSKAALASFIFSPVFINQQDVELITRLQDEICNDTVLNILSCALEDDDGVSAVAFEALGRLIIDIQDDNVMKEIKQIKGLSCPPIFSSCHGLWTEGCGDEGGGIERFVSRFQDYDAAMYSAEIRWRLLHSVLSPRTRKIMNRVLSMRSKESQIRSIPFLNQLILFVYKNDTLDDMQSAHDREAYAKRWFEFDIATMVDEYVNILLVPLLVVDRGLGVATNALLFCSASRINESWFDHLMSSCQSSLEKCLPQIESSRYLDQQMDLLALVLISLRGSILEDKVKEFELIASLLLRVPSTMVVADGVLVSALQQTNGSRRKPRRCGFWSEIALRFLLADERDTKIRNFNNEGEEFSPVVAIKSLFESPAMQMLFNSQYGEKTEEHCQVLDSAGEVVYTFCAVAHVIGKALIVQPTSNEATSVESSKKNCESWTSATLSLLHFFVSCLEWEKETDEKALENSCTLMFAAQKSYIELLRLVLMRTGVITASLSIYNHFIPSNNKSDEQNQSYAEAPVFADYLKAASGESDMLLLVARILELCSNAKLSRSVRLSLMCLLCDVWIRNSKLVMSQTSDSNEHVSPGPVDVDEEDAQFNEITARSLLSLLGAEISKLIAEEKTRSHGKIDTRSSNPSKLAAEQLRYLLMCIACVESIGYNSQLCANHFADLKSSVDEEESARYIVSVCVVVLKGQGRIDDSGEGNDEGADDRSASSDLSSLKSPPRSPRSKARITAFTTECSDAAKRLSNFVGLHDDISDDDDPDSKMVVDFNCLCPLFKRSSFEIPSDESDEKHLSNDEWKLSDKITLVNFKKNKVFASAEYLNISLEYLLGPQRFVGNHFDLGYLMNLYRQHLCQQINSAIQFPRLKLFNEYEESDIHSKLHRDRVQKKIKSTNPLWLPGSPGRVEYSPRNSIDPSASWKETIHTVTGCSDPISVVLNYAVRRHYAFDGSVTFKFVVTLQIYNITPVTIPNGLRIELQVCPKNPKKGGTAVQSQYISPITVRTEYQKELQAGHNLIWETIFEPDHLWSSEMKLKVKITFNGIVMESESSVCDVIRLDKESSEDSKSIVDVDGNKDLLDNEPKEIEKTSTMDISIYGNEVTVPHEVTLLPCPQVFFGDASGDEKMFLFLWLSMPFHLPAIPFSDEDNISDGSSLCYQFLTKACNMKLNNGGNLTDSWAIETWFGKHLLVIFEDGCKDDETSSQFHIKSDDQDLMESLFQ